MSKKLNRVGEKYVTKEGYEVEIIEYVNGNDCTVRFDDGTIIKNRMFYSIKIGSISNPFHPAVCGVGYLGIGDYKCSINKKKTKQYVSWHSMLVRCYAKNLPTYTNCSVHPDWHNFQNFAEWFDKNHKEGMDLDKDILSKGNKVYGPDTCTFVPSDVNTLFVKGKRRRGKYPIGVYYSKVARKFSAMLNKTNIRECLGLFNTAEEAFYAYKEAKEKYIKEVAEKYKSVITIECYNALMNYEVEITD